MIAAGRLDRRVTIQRLTEGPRAPSGAKTFVPVTFATVWTERRELGATEQFQAQQHAAKVTVIFTIRWLEGVTTLMRLVCEGRTYDITGVREIGRREGLELDAWARTEVAS